MNNVEDLAVLTTKRAYEQMMLKLGREPSEAEVLLFVTQCQLAAVAHMLLPNDADMLRYWQLTHAIVTSGDVARGKA